MRTLYADTDRSTVVYHANYLRYFEFGRASLMRDAAYPYREIEESGYVYPIIDLGDPVPRAPATTTIPCGSTPGRRNSNG